jgi:hypothetical protein
VDQQGLGRRRDPDRGVHGVVDALVDAYGDQLPDQSGRGCGIFAPGWMRAMRPSRRPLTCQEHSYGLRLWEATIVADRTLIHFG